ncbi:class I SAM-dependent methyltransferase [uncultured Paludibaculum sp.]|uniref:class I SAM-dependent methyltransferase n=1 Tax=uncultured Paludibaculum sp. TaxID=1765020 RepID=UPI002AAC2213|nr:class I SAM-dependent methyltransferase [uncultured Paludibaculum sp.]
MRYETARRVLPDWLRRYIYSFEAMIEDAVTEFAAGLPDGARVLDAGAGEGQYSGYFQRHRYMGVDLGVGDNAWDYGALDVVADLNDLPFPDKLFDASLNIVTMEHLREPKLALREIARVLKPGGVLLVVAPHEWEVHQSPHDYFRYTRHGLAYLFAQAGLELRTLEPAGGYFRLVARRLLSGLQFFPGPLKVIPAVVFLPLALVLPLFDGLDKEKNFTLGYKCVAVKALGRR